MILSIFSPSLLAIKNLQNQFIFKIIFLISLFGEILPVKKRLEVCNYFECLFASLLFNLHRMHFCFFVFFLQFCDVAKVAITHNII